MACFQDGLSWHEILDFYNWNWLLVCILFDEFNVRQWLSESYASWPSTIGITQEELENLHCDVDPWMMSFKKWIKTAESEDFPSILEDLDESGSNYKESKCKIWLLMKVLYMCRTPKGRRIEKIFYASRRSSLVNTSKSYLMLTQEGPLNDHLYLRREACHET